MSIGSPYSFKIGNTKYEISEKCARSLIEQYTEKIRFSFGDTTFPSCLGIPSSNMTMDIPTIEFVLTKLEDFPLGWITLKSCRNREKKRTASRIYHIKTRICDSVLLRGQHEFLTIEEAIKLSNYTRELLKKIYGKDNEVKIILSFFSMATSITSWEKIIKKLKDADFDLLEISVKYIAKFHHRLYMQPYTKHPDWFRYISHTHEFINLIHDAVTNSIDKGILYKFSPDVPFIENLIINLASKGKPGFIMFDSDKLLPILPSLNNPVNTVICKTESGYLKSGCAIAGKALTIQSIRKIYVTSRFLEERGLGANIIASGGIQEAGDFITRLLCGAKGGEICTATFRHGFEVYWKVLLGLLKFMEVNQLDDIKEVSGLVLRNLTGDAREYYDEIYVKITDECTKCGLCFCWHGAFIKEYRNGRLVDLKVNPEKCIGCLSCYSVCMNYRLGKGMEIKRKP